MEINYVICIIFSLYSHIFYSKGKLFVKEAFLSKNIIFFLPLQESISDDLKYTCIFYDANLMFMLHNEIF